MPFWIIVPTVVAVVAHLAFELPLGWVMFVGLVVLPACGVLATMDDEFPGGWNNPDGKTPPSWSYAAFWGEFLFRGSFSLGGFAIDSGVTTAEGLTYAGACAVGVVSGYGIIRQWPIGEVGHNS